MSEATPRDAAAIAALHGKSVFIAAGATAKSRSLLLDRKSSRTVPCGAAGLVGLHPVGANDLGRSGKFYQSLSRLHDAGRTFAPLARPCICRLAG